MRTTIKDIAKASGMSITAVSLVLNNKPNKIAEESKKLIREKAKELNYIPNQMARSLVSSSSKTIGLIVPDITNLYFAEIARVVQNAARSKGYTLILCNSDNEVERQVEYIQTLYKNGVVGIIMGLTSSHETNMLSFSLIRKLNIPTVLIDESALDYDIDSIIVNEKYGAYIATKYLISQGHSRIGVITGPMKLQSTIERLEGYRQALQEENIEADAELLYVGDYKIESGEQGAAYLIGKEATGIFAFNDMMACGVYKETIKEGKSIPDDISVIGFDNIAFAKILPIPLTTIEQPMNEIGTSAVERLLERIKHPEASTVVETFKPGLIIRNSTKEKEKK